MKSTLKRGFTLIELLVVIAIIGILASVVLASLNSARDKGTDAANKSNLNNMRAQAEILYDDNGDYDGVCALEGVTAAGAACNEAGDDSAWAASVTLLSPSPTEYYCVDSTGAASQGTTALGTATACP